MNGLLSKGNSIHVKMAMIVIVHLRHIVEKTCQKGAQTNRETTVALNPYYNRGFENPDRMLVKGMG